MSYWDKITGLLKQKKEEKPEEEMSEIEFTPDEWREMNDPTTAVGRLLNPQTPLRSYMGEEYPRFDSGGIELFKKGRHSPLRSIEKNKAYEEALAATAEAYLKDAEKRGIVSSSDDRITKNYKIINDLIKQKNLEDVKIKNEYTPDAYGKFDEATNTVKIDPELNNPFEYLDERKLDKRPLKLKDWFSGKKDSELYPKMSMSKQKQIQENKLNKHLNTTIHELRHAEDFKKDPKNEGHYHGHFLNVPNYFFDETSSGKIHDIHVAALQRLSNMGTKKKKLK